MKSDIDDLCDAFIVALTDAGYAPKSIENYKQISKRSKRFCTENDYGQGLISLGRGLDVFLSKNRRPIQFLIAGKSHRTALIIHHILVPII